MNCCALSSDGVFFDLVCSALQDAEIREVSLFRILKFGHSLLLTPLLRSFFTFTVSSRHIFRDGSGYTFRRSASSSRVFTPLYSSN